MYAIAHVGTTVQLDAIGLAEQAMIDGADAIATVPPYYELPATIAGTHVFMGVYVCIQTDGAIVQCYLMLFLLIWH